MQNLLTSYSLVSIKVNSLQVEAFTTVTVLIAHTKHSVKIHQAMGCGITFQELYTLAKVVLMCVLTTSESICTHHAHIYRVQCIHQATTGCAWNPS